MPGMLSFPVHSSSRIAHYTNKRVPHIQRPVDKRHGTVYASIGGDYAKRNKDLEVESSMLRELSTQAMDAIYEETRQRLSKTSQQKRLSIGGLKSRIAEATQMMHKNLVERDAEVRLLLLAALSGEHILFIGPPGTAKSELGRRLSKLCTGAFFERLLTKFSVPEELFGPLSMRALEEDAYVRQIEGYLPSASVAFIDEIFKANSAILNTLLTVLNERLFDNGSMRVPIPLICLVGASNELPESEELDALYDRFLIRKSVAQVTSGGLVELLSIAGTPRDSLDYKREDGATEADGLNMEDFIKTRYKAREQVTVPMDVIHLMADLRSWLQEKCEPPVYVSDRRLVKAVDLMRVSAYCNGRSEVSEYDTLLLHHVFWNQPPEAERIREWLLDNLAADTNAEQISFLLSGLFGRACQCLDDNVKREEVLSQMRELKNVLTEKLFYILQSVEGKFPQLVDHVWLPKDEAESVMYALLPKLQKSRKEVETRLFEVVALEVALERKVEAVQLATLMPKQWGDFIRRGPVEDIKSLGVISAGSP